MKKLLLSLFLISGITYGQGDPAPYIKGQAATGLGNQASTVFVPNQQSTKINAYQARIETGNGNLLSNPSFEAGTYNSGWTCSLGSTTLETTAKTDGNKANAINSIGAGVRCYQTSTTNAANLKGLLGSAILKVKTTDSIYKVCGLVDGNAAANERNCITVKPTSADLPFYPARTDFYMGGTSNGIVVYTTTTTSQPTVIDDAFVGVFNGGISQFSNNTGWSDCGLVAGDFQGFGTPTGISLQCKRDATDLLMRGKFTSGAPTGVEARVGLKLSGVSLTSASAVSIPSIQKAGTLQSGDVGSTSSTGASVTVLTEPSVSYVTFSTRQSSYSGLAKRLGSEVFTSGVSFSLEARIPIAGWEANTNAAIAGCVDAFGCTDTFSAKVSSTGAISEENVAGWLTSCTNATTPTCTIRSGLFSVTPNCWMKASTGAVGQVTQSTTSVFGIIVNASQVAITGNREYFCQKSGSDFKPKTVVVSPLQGYVKVPGAENLNVESFKVSYGATATTACTVNGNCAYKDELSGSGNYAVSTIARTASGAYLMTLLKTYMELKCTINSLGGGNFLGAVPINVSNSNSASFQTGVATTNTDSYGTLDCTGVY